MSQRTDSRPEAIEAMLYYDSEIAQMYRREIDTLRQQLAETVQRSEHWRSHYDAALANWNECLVRMQAAEAKLAEAKEEIAQWKTWGVVEIAVRNVNVSSYMNHWESRASKAEVERDQLRERALTAEAKLGTIGVLLVESGINYTALLTDVVEGVRALVQKQKGLHIQLDRQSD